MKRKKTEASGESITVTLGQLVACGMGDTPAAAVPPLTALSQTRMDGKASFKVARLLRDITKELETYNKIRVELCEKHGKLSEDKARYVFPTPESVLAFEKAINEVLSVEIELHHKKMPELLDVVQLTPAEMMTLEWLLV
ncbi:MAG TPA: hypothetical protein VHU41_19740 [Thermoanaerobaculia bacterium]|nr:hypothetical protein [Thermoanaerobaculia bacterium]